MTIVEHGERLKDSLLRLGARRLAALAIIGVTVFAVTGLGSRRCSADAFTSA